MREISSDNAAMNFTQRLLGRTYIDQSTNFKKMSIIGSLNIMKADAIVESTVMIKCLYKTFMESKHLAKAKMLDEINLTETDVNRS